MADEAGREKLRQRLTPLQYAVTQEAATEAAFTGIYWDHHEAGVYRCVVCGAAQFGSDEKFDSHCGWPSFYDVRGGASIATRADTSHGMVRTEVQCGNCGAHLGHVFADGPAPTGLRYCINSAALDFEKGKAK